MASQITEIERAGASPGMSVTLAPPVAARKGGTAWTAVVRLAVGLGVLGLILRQVEVGEIGELWGGRMLVAIAAATGLLLLAQAFSAARWGAILGPGGPPWSFLFRLYLVGQFFSLFLPTSIGGDAVRATAAARALSRPGAVISSVVLDRIFGLLGLAAYLCLGIVASPALVASLAGRVEWTLSPGSVAVGLGAALAAGGILVVLRGRLRRIAAVSDAWDLVRGLARSPAALLRAGLLALAVQGLYLATWIVLSAALGFGVPIAFFLLAVPVVSLVAMLPISISGLGLREGAWLFLLAPFGIPAGHAVAFGLLYFVAFTVLGVVGGIWFMARGVDLEVGVPGTVPADPRAGAAGAGS